MLTRASTVIYPIRTVEAVEPGELLQESHLHRVRGSVALLGDDDLRLALKLRIFAVIVLRTVDEHHHISVLLDGAGFAQIAQLRFPALLARLGGTTQLR